MIMAYLHSFFWLFLTYSLAPYFYFRIFYDRRGPIIPLKILVIQTAKIGDLVCSTPVFREIKKRFPDSHLAALVTAQSRDILKNNLRLNEIISLNDYSKFALIKKLRKEKYDWVFNLLPDSFSNIIAFWSLVPNRVSTTHEMAGAVIKLLSIFNNHRLEYKSHTWLIGHYLNLLKFMGIENCSEEKEVFMGPKEEKKALDFLTRNNFSSSDLLIGIGVIPGNKIKQWDLSKFAVLSDLLTESSGARIIFTGSSSDNAQIEKVQKMMKNNSINAAGFFKLSELPALLKRLKLFIGADSGPLYIANALLAPVVDIGGPYDVREQAPSGGRYKILHETPTDCSFMNPESRFCRERLEQHIKKITPQEVFEAARDLLAHNVII